jgi:Tol biopolymer transport system component
LIAVHDHGQILELAAAAIDFELDPVERAKLDAALESCPLCRRQASAMRATATILGRAPEIGTPSRVRDVVVGAALRSGNRSPGWRPLLAASLSLVAVLGGAAIYAGNRGSNVGPPSSPPAASPGVTAVALASPSTTPSAVASAAPTATQTPVATEPSGPAVQPTPDDNGPLRAGDTAAMVTDGRLVIRTAPGTGPESAIYKTRIYQGQRVLVLDGPVEASGYAWFHVRLGTIDGWVAATGLSGEPWLAPVRNGLIAFVRRDVSNPGIDTIAPDGSRGVVPLFTDPGIIGYRQLTWSPDGRRLAFVGTAANSASGTSEVFVIDADGSNLVQVTRNEVDDDSPAWSPDGTQLAVRVAQVDPLAPGDSNVVVTPVDRLGVTVLGRGENPVWSPDGRQIAMTVAVGGSSHLWVQAPNGDGRRQVADVSVAAVPPAWSPDGQSLAFSSSGLFLVDVDSGSVTEIAAEPGTWPAWSTAGRIAFSTIASAAPAIFIVNADGTGLDRVAGDQALVSRPSWSPDGSRLLVGDQWPGSIALVDPGAGTLSAIAGTEDGAWPAWQPRLP